MGARRLVLGGMGLRGNVQSLKAAFLKYMAAEVKSPFRR